MGRKKVLIETLWNVKIINGVKNLFGIHCINRNIVECKVIYHLLYFLSPLRINRNIVECKVEKTGRSSVTESCINRNIVECKEIEGRLLFYDYEVLIETLWNVKFFYDGIWRGRPDVLIETLWNVKRFMLI